MSTEEILTVKEDIHEMKGDIKGLVSAMNDLKISLVENYLKKSDCKECKENQKTRQAFWDLETKKTTIKWSGIIALVVIVLLAGRGLAELFNIIPK